MGNDGIRMDCRGGAGASGSPCHHPYPYTHILFDNSNDSVSIALEIGYERGSD